MHYLLIPGNPPAVHFYELWKNEILARQPSWQVRVSAYPEVGPVTDPQASMESVLQTHLKQLQQFRKDTGAPITLVGHSLGGYVANQLLERAPDDIRQAILIHPFLGYPDPRGKLILQASTALSPRETLKRGLVQSRKFFEYIFKDLPDVTTPELKTALNLAHVENMLIGQKKGPILIAEPHRHKVRVFHTPGDIWCTPKMLAHLKGQVPLHECAEPHDFITQARHRQSLFEQILKFEQKSV